MIKTIHVAGAVIRNGRGEILCALRSACMSMPGLWEFPGGKLEPGESPQSCLVREIKEELGCEIEVGELIADVVHEYPAIRVHLITCSAVIVGGVPEAREHERLIWLPASRLRELEWAAADLPTVERLLS